MNEYSEAGPAVSDKENILKQNINNICSPLKTPEIQYLNIDNL